MTLSVPVARNGFKKDGMLVSNTRLSSSHLSLQTGQGNEGMDGTGDQWSRRGARKELATLRTVPSIHEFVRVFESGR